MGGSPRRYYTSCCLASLPGGLLACRGVWKRAVKLPSDKSCGSGLLTDRFLGLLPDGLEAKTRHLGNLCANQISYFAALRACLLACRLAWALGNWTYGGHAVKTKRQWLLAAETWVLRVRAQVAKGGGVQHLGAARERNFLR